MHVARMTVKEDGERSQKMLWNDIRTAPREFMEPNAPSVPNRNNVRETPRTSCRRQAERPCAHRPRTGYDGLPYEQTPLPTSQPYGVQAGWLEVNSAYLD